MPRGKPVPRQHNFPPCPDECVHFGGDPNKRPCSHCVRNLGITTTLYDFMEIKEGGTNEFEKGGDDG